MDTPLQIAFVFPASLYPHSHCKRGTGGGKTMSF